MQDLIYYVFVMQDDVDAETDRAQAAEQALQNSITQINTTLSNKADTSSLASVATSGSYTDLSNKSDIPAKVSQLENDTGFITASSIPSDYVTSEQLTNAGYLTATSAAETYATKSELNSKADTSDIPANVSDLTNDAGYLTDIPSEYITETDLSIELSDYAKTTNVVKKSGDTMTGALTINKNGTALTVSGSASINTGLNVGTTGLQYRVILI